MFMDGPDYNVHGWTRSECSWMDQITMFMDGPGHNVHGTMFIVHFSSCIVHNGWQSSNVHGTDTNLVQLAGYTWSQCPWYSYRYKLQINTPFEWHRQLLWERGQKVHQSRWRRAKKSNTPSTFPPLIAWGDDNWWWQRLHLWSWQNDEMIIMIKKKNSLEVQQAAQECQVNGQWESWKHVVHFLSCSRCSKSFGKLYSWSSHSENLFHLNPGECIA